MKDVGIKRRRGSRIVAPALLAFTVLLAACGGSSDTAAPAPAPAPAPAEPEAPVEEVIDFPTKDIRLVVPFNAGGGYDTQARLIAPFLQKHLPNNVNVVVDNIGGGGGVAGTQQVFGAEPDGHTILQSGINSLLITQFLNPGTITYDMTAFEWLGQYQRDLRGIAVSNDLPVETWADLVELSKTRPLRTGGNGVGTPPTSEATALSQLAGFEIDIIDYDGSSGIQAAFARGELDLAVVNYTSILRWQADGDARLFVVIAPERGEYAPDVPTIVEAGMERAELDRILQLPVIGQPRMFAAPPGTPAGVVRILQQAFQDAMEDPEFRALFTERQEIYLPVFGDAAGEIVVATAAAIEAESDLITALFGE